MVMLMTLQCYEKKFVSDVMIEELLASNFDFQVRILIVIFESWLWFSNLDFHFRILTFIFESWFFSLQISIFSFETK